MAAAFDAIAKKIDRRFDAVDEHFAEQRAYIEFAYERLDQKMSTGFAEVKADLAGVKEDLAGVKADLRGLTSRFDRLEHKLDQFIDRHAP